MTSPPRATNWKIKLYESYVSSGQSVPPSDITALRLDNFPQYRHIIATHLPANNEIRIADLGCGYGQMLFCLKAMGYKNLVGIDASSEQVTVAHRLGLTEVTKGDLMPFLRETYQSYDALFLMDVLEHLTKQDVVDLLDSCHQALAENGQLILHVPNAEGLFGMRVRYGDFTHETCFTPQSVRQLALSTGFKEISVVEEKPVVHGLNSLVRRALWTLLTLRERLLLLAETGSGGHILSQNMLAVLKK